MKDTPILMCGPMVLATLADRKTQTRRLVKTQPEWRDEGWYWKGGNALLRVGYGADYVHSNWSHVERAMLKVCPYGQPGDRLWVRETWKAWERPRDGVDGIIFACDGTFQSIKNTKEAAELWCAANANGKHGTKWRPSIFMPRWASRLTLEITAIRVERLQEINEEDCQAEGVEHDGLVGYYCEEPTHNSDGVHRCNWRAGYAALWNSINGPDSWAKNPFVWVISFRKLSNHEANHRDGQKAHAE